MIFKATERKLIQRRKKLREKMRKIKAVDYKDSLTYAHLVDPKYNKLNQKYYKLGHKWWDLHKQHNWLDGKLGTDVTDMPFSKSELIVAIHANREEDLRLQEVPGTKQYNSLRVLEDNSVKVEYRKDSDGIIWKYDNGVKNESFSVSPTSLGTLKEEE